MDDTVFANDVWIGYDSLIIPEVKIGEGAIIAARSVVVNDIDPYTIVEGNPAQPIKARFTAETIKILLDIKWWDWDIDKITQNLETTTSTNLIAPSNAVWYPSGNKLLA